jgi:putative phosphoesterase
MDKLMESVSTGMFQLELAGQPGISRKQAEFLQSKDEFRLLVVSDSHNSVKSIVRLLEQVPSTDLVLHLGDHVSDYAMLADIIQKPLFAVRGNCDGYNHLLLPEQANLKIAGHQILMVHGHNRKINVKSGLHRLRDFSSLQMPVPELVLYGHTHIYHDEVFEIENSFVRAINPGSCAIMESTLSGGVEIILNRSAIAVRRLWFVT